MTVSNQSTVIQILPADVTGARATGWWGMVLFIASEATFFASLVASYFYLQSNAPVWPPDGKNPELLLPIIGTVVLLGSSAPMWFADRSIAHGNQMGLRLGLALSFALGVAFLVIQGIEYNGETFKLHDSTYSSLFYTITGAHGIHVFIGLLMNAFMQLRAWKGHFSARRRLAIQNVALYWHFVDAVWIVIFASLYISPRLL